MHVSNPSLSVLSLSLLVGAFLSGCPGDTTDGGGGNDGGMAGNDGGMAGNDGGMAGNDGGTAGTDGGMAGTDGGVGPNCGASDICDDIDEFFAHCAENFCGTFENVQNAFCASDDRVICVCTSGECDRSECTETSTCTFDAAGDELCDAEGASLCGGEDNVRETFCFESASGPRCEIICDFGAIACVE